MAARRRFEADHHTASEAEGYQAKAEAVAAAQGEGRLDDSLPVVDLFTMVLRITESWLDAPPALLAVSGEQPRSPARLAQHRAALIEAVRRITTPGPPAHAG
ncbi:hypothetical protein ACFYSJ_36160 [Streptomyces sp. NPDC005248]|uniref:hypothetical protein n=1 Tax=Streptomyces sp. NPDC005248 TaxID=3364709 RepID=UPI0036BEF498